MVREYESQIERLEEKLVNAETNPFDKLARDKLENEVDQLRAENAMMAKQRLLNQHTEYESQELNDRLRAAQEKTRKAKGLLLRFIMR